MAKTRKTSTETALATQNEKLPAAVIATATDSTDFRSELENIAYEKAFDSVLHYSNIIFRTRIGMLTLSALIASLILGVRLAPATNSSAASITVDVKAMLAYIYSIMIVLFYSIEVGYYRRLAAVVKAAAAIELKRGASAMFQDYNLSWHVPIYFLYGAMVLLFDVLFLVQSLGIEGVSSQGYLLALTLLLSLWPLVTFFTVIWRYPRQI